MVCVKVIGNHNGITMAGSHGHFELNVFKPLIIHNILQSIEIMSDSSKTFAIYCVKGIRQIKKNKFSLRKLIDDSYRFSAKNRLRSGCENCKESI